MTQDVVVIRIILAAVLGGIVGIEREIHGCAAGLRTHILVSVGSAVFMITSILVAVSFSGLGAVDPSRIGANVVAGIGFLGAGAIIRYGASIRGLTTAASIWAVSAIGLAVAAGAYVAAGVSTVIVVATLFLSRLEERMALKSHVRKLVISADFFENKTEDQINDIVEMYGGTVKHVEIGQKSDEEKKKSIVVSVALSRLYHRDVAAEILALPGISGIDWK